MTVTSDAATRLVRAAPGAAARYVPALVLAVDLVVLTLAMVLAVYGRESLPSLAGPVTVNLGALAAPLIALGWLLCLVVGGAYQPGVLGAGTEEYRRVLSASIVAASIVGVGCYLSNQDLSRGFFLLLFGVGTPALAVTRVAARRGALRGATSRIPAAEGAGRRIDLTDRRGRARAATRTLAGL